MREILRSLEQAIVDRRPVVYTALVETRGSTPQKPGATMLVFPDGSQVGTLGGGCVEAEVKRRALRLLDEGRAEIVTFQLDNDYGWDDGLICGGRMKMLIDPVRPGVEVGYFQTLCDRVTHGQGCTQGVVIEPKSAGGEVSADCWLLDEKGDVLARRGGGGQPADLLSNLKPLPQRPRPYLAAGISYLPHLQRCRLLIVGGGHVGQKVAALAHEADFDLWIVDDREAYCSAERFPHAERRIVGPMEASLEGLEIDENTFCIIVTRGHQHDEEALFSVVKKPARFIGMIGSRRKIRMIFEDLLREGIPPEALRRVHAPLGLEIGSQTVPEIAVSIVAELIAERNLEEAPDRYRRPSLLDEIGPRRVEESHTS
jgi:xanthine dehydrogenase accessory factor